MQTFWFGSANLQVFESMITLGSLNDPILQRYSLVWSKRDNDPRQKKEVLEVSLYDCTITFLPERIGNNCSVLNSRRFRSQTHKCLGYVSMNATWAKHFLNGAELDQRFQPIKRSKMQKNSLATLHLLFLSEWKSFFAPFAYKILD